MKVIYVNSQTKPHHIKHKHEPLLLIDTTNTTDDKQIDESILGKYFPTESVAEKPFLMSTKSLYSTALQEDGKLTARLIQQVCPTTETILDACANVGGNTYWFARQFKHVIAVENDPHEYHRLENNMKDVLQLQNVQTILGSCLDVLSSQAHFNCIFFDPPWGGSMYKFASQLVLGLDKQDILPIIHKCIDENKATIVVLKHPVNVYMKSEYTNFLQQTISFQKHNRIFYQLSFFSKTNLPHQLQDTYLL
jgi:16S rRNA G966 N2-methylase RsmD